MNNKIELNFKTILKQRLEEKSGIRLFDFSDCLKLSTLLSHEKINISAHTIARIFGILKKDHTPYRSTLSLMVSYLGYSSFELFCQMESQLLSQRLKVKHAFDMGDFSFPALELAIEQSSWKDVLQLLEAYQINFRKQAFTDYLGNTVRNHPNRNDFLKALAHSENGRLLFYESFVDEDDPDGYYSEALINYYSKEKKDFGSQFFIQSYLASKNIYRNQPVKNQLELSRLLKDFNSENIHFHHLSRYYELRLLLNARKNKPFSDSANLLLEMLEKLKKYHPHDRRWILARSLKAILHTGNWEKSIQLMELKNELLLGYHSMEGQVNSVADMIIQLCAHRLWKMEKFLFPVITIKEFNLSESQIRMAIEGTTALLYAQEPVKNIILRNLKPFIDRTGNSWVINLI
jgi:hypothetical protein